MSIICQLKKEQKKCISVYIRLLQLAKRGTGPVGYCPQFLFPTCFIKETIANTNTVATFRTYN